MPFRPRILAIPIAAAVIAALVGYKLTRNHREQNTTNPQLGARRPAPRFELLDSENALVKFERYLGRHRILLVFFDGKRGADRAPVLSQLRKRFDRLEANNVVVVAVSTALPQENRAVFDRVGKFPFPVLSDPAMRVHRMWGRYDESSGEALTGTFLVDRAGNVAWSGDAPQPLSQPKTTIRKLAGASP